jgi:hypothetical protein
VQEGDESVAETKAKGRGGKTGKAALAQAAKRLAAVWESWDEKAGPESLPRLKAALHYVHAAAVRAAADEFEDCRIVGMRHGMALAFPEGAAWVFLYPYALEDYLAEGAPLPPGARIAALDVFYVDLAHAALELRSLVRAVSSRKFGPVRARGLWQGEFITVDARAWLASLAREIREAGSPARWLRKVTRGAPVDLEAARQAACLWKDWVDGRAAL